MPEGQVLEFSGITKRFGAVTAVSDFSARVEPGRVTGFLGPNGAGKTTTLRVLLGLVRPTSGSATIGGAPYASLREPLQTVGAVLEASSFHPGRTAANHLKVYAQAAGLPASRVDDTLGLTGLADVGGRKVGGFSLGMRQRLGLAYALLGDPGVLVLDEPANGLDPEGIKWMRGFLRQLAREGRTVFVSSHLLSEVQQTVDSVLIISQGRLVFQGGLQDLADPAEAATVVDSPDRAALSAALTSAGIPFELLRSGFTVRGVDPLAVGQAAASAGVALSSLQRRGPALEEVFLDLVSGARVHPTAAALVGGVVPMTPVEGTDQDAAAGAAAVGAGAVDADAVAPSDAETAGASDAETAGASDAETAAVAADLSATTGGAPGAAIAVGTAAGAAGWTAAAGDERAVPPTDEEPLDDEPSATTAPTPAVFAVASTGVIDIIPSAGDPATDAYQDGLNLDADPDVEALGAIDAELTDDDPAADRPWQPYVKTESDVEADAFFAAFTADDDEEGDAAPEDAASDEEQESDEQHGSGEEPPSDEQQASGEERPRDEEGEQR